MLGTPRGPTTSSHAPRKPVGDRRRSHWECVDIPSVNTDFRTNVQEESHGSEFPKGIGARGYLYGTADSRSPIRVARSAALADVHGRRAAVDRARYRGQHR